MEVNKGWAFLACRVLALYFGFLFLQQFLSLPLPYLHGGNGIANYVAITWSLSFMAVVIFLWFGAPWLSTKLIPKNLKTTDASSVNLESVLSLVVALLGLLLIINALPNIVIAIVPNGPLPTTTLIEPIIKMVIGIFLIFKASGVARLLKMTRGL